MQNEKNNVKSIDASKVINNKIYYDDNRKIYRIDKDLISNNIYTLNRYTYKTNDRGAILKAEAKSLQLKTHEGRLSIKETLNDIGKGYQKPGDNRGHLIGDQFGGFNGIGNLIPQNAAINGGTFRQLENKLAGFIKEGKSINYELELHYPDNDIFRPDVITVRYIIDAVSYVEIFSNP